MKDPIKIKVLKSLLKTTALAFALAAPAHGGQTLSNYQAVIYLQGPSTYFPLDGSLASAADPTITLFGFGAGGFTYDTCGSAGDAYVFANTTDYLDLLAPIVISGGGTSNTTSTASGSVTFLFRTLDAASNTGQRYLFSAGSDPTNHNAFALFLENTNAANGDPNALKLRFGDSTTTILPAAAIVPDTWYYVAVTYLESRSPNKASWYVGRPGGTLYSGTTVNSPDAVAGNGLGVYFGNRELFDAGYRNPGNGALDELAFWNRELSASEVNAQFAALPSSTAPPVSGYRGVVSGQAPKYYFQMDGSLTNATGDGTVLSAVGDTIGFGYDYFGNFLTTNAAAFTSTNDALVVSNNLLSGGGNYTGTPGTGAGTISFLFHSLTGTNNSGQRFLFSAGGSTVATNAFGVYMENWKGSNASGAIKIRFGEASKPILGPDMIVPGVWYYCAVTYDESLTNQQVSWYLGQVGGALNNGVLTYDVGALAGQGDIFVIGNHTNFNAGWRSPGIGRVDEFAIWNRVLSPTEITSQFAALAPVGGVAQPVLTIGILGGNILVSWPATTPSTFGLETTNVLDSTTIGAASWPSAGTASVVGANFVVTNAIAGGNRFYRLHSP